MDAAVNPPPVLVEPTTLFQEEIRRGVNVALRRAFPMRPELLAEHVGISSDDIHFLFGELYKFPNETASVNINGCEWLPGSVTTFCNWLNLTHDTTVPRHFALVDQLKIIPDYDSLIPNDVVSIVAAAQKLRILSVYLEDLPLWELSQIVNNCSTELEELEVSVDLCIEEGDSELNLGRLPQLREFTWNDNGLLRTGVLQRIVDGILAANNISRFQHKTVRSEYGDVSIQGQLPVLADMIRALGEGRDFSLQIQSEFGILSDPVEVGNFADAVAHSKGLSCLGFGLTEEHHELDMICPASNLSVLLQGVQQSTSLEKLILDLEIPNANKDVLLGFLPFIKHLKSLTFFLCRSNIDLNDTMYQTQIIDVLKQSCSLEEILLRVDPDPADEGNGVRLSSFSLLNANPYLEEICDRNKHVTKTREKLAVLLPLPDGNHDEEGEEGNDREEGQHIPPPDGVWAHVIYKAFDHQSGGLDAGRLAVYKHLEALRS